MNGESGIKANGMSEFAQKPGPDCVKGAGPADGCACSRGNASILVQDALGAPLHFLRRAA